MGVAMSVLPGEEGFRVFRGLEGGKPREGWVAARAEKIETCVRS